MSKTVGEYLLKEKIGKGSYADVYKGTHKVTGAKYAIKTISKDILSEPKLLAGLESEIKIMREFVHPNIVCLHEYFSSEKNFYLILELCEGGDLSKFIKKKKRIDERLAHNFLTQITSGLAFLHEKNFIHRDLKPANVLLSEFSDNAVLKLADFGFARQLSVASLAQTRCGTPLYMAPEILESKDYDGKADIWSVGCIFYEMLVGTSPFKGANEGDLLMNIKTKELNVPNDIILSEVSIQILIKLLERYPLRRAALPQLVALCAHITSNPPPLPVGSSSSGAGGEEAGLALPIPSPTSSETKSGGDLHHSNRGRTPEAPSANAEPRRRSSTSSIPSNNEAQQGNESAAFISPVKANPRDYPGGPAVGNLRGMFAPTVDANPHTPPPPNYQDSRQSSNTYSPSNQHQGQSQGQGQESQQQGHARRSSGTYYDPQISKTVRAPYANPNPMPNKYPSPSSSPPSGGMSNVGAGFSMQTSHNARSAPTHSNSIASSPGTIGMMGNLIAYVFNPSPSPPSTMNESARAHAHLKQHQAGQHGRSISLDRAAPPSFGGQFGGSGGTPPPVGGTRARGQTSQNNRNIREDHFAYTEQDSLYNARDGGNSNMSDDDFVMIDKSSTERNDARGTPTNQNHPSQQASQTNSASTSSFSGGSGATSAGNSTGLLVGVVPPPVPSLQTQTRAAPPVPNDHTNYNNNNSNNNANNYANQSYHLESEVRTHEAAAMHAFYASIVQKCEVYCAVVAAISALGDQFVRESLTSAPAEKPRSRGGSMDGGDDDDDSIAGFLQQPSQDNARHSHSIHNGHKPAQHQAAVDRYLTACSLYLHALSILANLLRSFDNSAGAEQAEPMRGVMQKLKSDVSTVFEQLIARAESCQKQIDQLVNPTGSASVHALSASKYTMPQAEPVMVQAALKREADASMEELLGNLNLASKLYASANELIEGVALTAHDPEDQRKLHLYSASLLDKHRSCRRRAEELLIFS